MKTYGQFCPLAQASQLLCERWILLIIRELMAGSTHFNDLHRGVPLMSPTLLSTRLKQLIKAGVVEHGGKQQHFDYRLTSAGEELEAVIKLMGTWGHRWAQSDLNEGDLDAGLLMWDMRRSIDPSAFPAQRVVVQFNFTDAPLGNRDWWLVAENGDIDLCLNDHGYEIDLIIRCSLKSMTQVWICQETFNTAVKKGAITVMGDPALTSKLQEWLRASGLSRLGAATQVV